MNDLEYTFLKMCQRRGKVLQSIASVNFQVRINFNLLAQDLLPVVANTFYFIDKVNAYCVGTTPGGTPEFTFTTNSGLASAGALKCRPFTAAGTNWGGAMEKIECDSLTWDNINHTSGDFLMMGTVFKITHTA